MMDSEGLLPVKEQFSQELRTVLYGLYDPAILRSSALITWLGLEQQRDPVGSLRKILTEGIEAMQPGDRTPLRSKTWRVYQILRRRYTEQRMQREVADDLGLSIRQMQREEKVAREMLADFLWKTCSPEDVVSHAGPLAQTTGDQTKRSVAANDPVVQGLEELSLNLPYQTTDAAEILQEALSTLTQVFLENKVTILPAASPKAVGLTVQAPILRQALLNLLNAAAGHAVAGTVSTHLDESAFQVQIHIHARPGAAGRSKGSAGFEDSVEMAERLISLCGGELITSLNAPQAGAQQTGFAATIILPIANSIPVLVVDDHADTLQLYQRYLSESRYQMSSAQNALQALEMVETTRPKVIVLDVMMPDIDGWALLSRMRVHPRLQGVPIIICSIIPQERLALSLGAADFLHKPVNQSAFLAALDQQAGLPVKESE